MTPGQDLSGASGILLNAAIVGDAHPLEAPIGRIPIGAQDGSGTIDHTQEKRTEIPFEREPFDDRETQLSALWRRRSIAATTIALAPG